MTAQEIAEKCAEVMNAVDGAARDIGIEFVSVAQNKAELKLQITKRHVNAHGFCHGGILFTLADSAFGYAGNSENQAIVTFDATITYLNPARLGSTITAKAYEVARTARTRVINVALTDEEGVQIADFRGIARTIKGTLF